MNEEFYEKINVLGPFGSGNSEPKFVIENLKVISSKIVAEKHIKSILCGKDGTIINSIAFNAKDSLLDTLLKTNNKKK